MQRGDAEGGRTGEAGGVEGRAGPGQWGVWGSRHKGGRLLSRVCEPNLAVVGAHRSLLLS